MTEVDFLHNSSLTTYAQRKPQQSSLTTLDTVSFTPGKQILQRLNTYGLNYQESFSKIVKNNRLDEF